MRWNASRPMPRPNAAFSSLGTSWHIESDNLTDELVVEVRDRIDTYDRTYSRFRSDSLVGRMAKSAGDYLFPSDLTPLLEVYQKLHRVTDGAVDPGVGSALESLGYDSEYSLRAGPITSTSSFLETMTVDGTRVHTDAPFVLDVGAVGKGQIVDIVAGILRLRGARRYLVDAGGDMAFRHEEPLRVGLEHPADHSTAIGVVELCEGAVCASGTNRRQWGDGVHHILDARTGRPTQKVIATWVVADTACEADGIATALFFAEPERIAEEFSFRFARMFADGIVENSVDFPGEIFR